MSRLQTPRVEDMTPDQREVHDRIASGPRGGVRGPVGIWLYSPELAQRAQSLGEFCRFGSTLPAKLRELAILVTAEHWRAGFEWNGHAPLALQAGLGSSVVDAVLRGNRPAFEHDDEQVVHAFATELLRTHAVSWDTWEYARVLLGEAGVVELVGLLGYYGLISMTIKAFEVPAGAAPDPFQVR